MAVNICIYLGDVAIPQVVRVDVAQLANLRKVKRVHRHARIHHQNIQKSNVIV